MSMHVISTEQIRRHVTIGPVIAAISEAFKALGRGDSAVFPVARGTGSDPGHFLGVKSGRDGSTGLLGVKAGSYHPANRLRNLPAHTSTTLLIDDDTAAVIAVVEADHLNGMRTAAANAVATQWLARGDAETLAVIGLGAQAAFEVEAVAAVRPIKRLLAASRGAERDRRFAAAVRERAGLIPEFTSAEAAVRQADIVVTVTPATAPVIEASWVRPGTHISAMGADNVGKMELPVALVIQATLFADYPDQAAIIGESQHIIREGGITLDQLKDRSLGALLTGRIPGRLDDAMITIFDSSGIAVQDIAAAKCALDIVLKAERAQPILSPDSKGETAS